ncbi:unnamed protein product, partial [Heterosigma akashiwo]
MGYRWTRSSGTGFSSHVLQRSSCAIVVSDVTNKVN